MLREERSGALPRIAAGVCMPALDCILPFRTVQPAAWPPLRRGSRPFSRSTDPPWSARGDERRRRVDAGRGDRRAGLCRQRAGAAAGGVARPSRDRARHPPRRAGSTARRRRTPSTGISDRADIRDRSGDEAGARRCRRRRPPLAALVGYPACDADAEGARSINEAGHPERDRGDAGGRPARLPQHDQHLRGAAGRGDVCSEDSPIRPLSLYPLHQGARGDLGARARLRRAAARHGIPPTRRTSATTSSSTISSCAACAASICELFEPTGDAQLRACRT